MKELEYREQEYKELEYKELEYKEQALPKPALPDRTRRAQFRRMEAADERQYMINDNFEVYEKQGAPTGAATFHYHSFFEIIYVLEGE